MAMLSDTSGERRRRVFTEQMKTDTARIDSHSSEGPSTPSRVYHTATLELQPRITSLAPTRRATLALIFLALELVVVGLAAAFVHLPELAVMVEPQHLRAFDFTVSGNLANWFSSTLLMLAAGISLIIYSVRRHRTDDYHGRYRIWRNASAAWLALGMAISTQPHLLAAELLRQTTGWLTWRQGTLWWLLPATLGFGYLLVRLLADMRVCLPAAITLLTAIGAGVGGWLIGQGLVSIGQPELRSVIASTTILSGHVLLLTALLVYLRNVILTADGQLGTRHKEQKAPNESTTAASKTKQTTRSKRSRHLKVDPAHETPQEQPNGKSKRGRAAENPKKQEETQWVDGSEGGNDNFDDETNGRRLSKAERRRLRKQKSRQQRAARH